MILTDFSMLNHICWEEANFITVDVCFFDVLLDSACILLNIFAYVFMKEVGLQFLLFESLCCLDIRVTAAS